METELIESEDGNVIVTNITPDELFIAIQPDEASRLEAIAFIEKQRQK